VTLNKNPSDQKTKLGEGRCRDPKVRNAVKRQSLERVVSESKAVRRHNLERVVRDPKEGQVVWRLALERAIGDPK
jgi:hypothetical protein